EKETKKRSDENRRYARTRLRRVSKNGSFFHLPNLHHGFDDDDHRRFFNVQRFGRRRVWCSLSSHIFHNQLFRHDRDGDLQAHGRQKARDNSTLGRNWHSAHRDRSCAYMRCLLCSCWSSLQRQRKFTGKVQLIIIFFRKFI
ncbi:unnamed protein product, partial [Oikopleura dioica]